MESGEGTNPDNLDKWKELYELSKEIFREEQTRFRRLDEKAAKYLTILSFFLGAAGLIGKWIANDLLPPNGWLEGLLATLGLLLIGSVFASWLLTFLVLRVRGVKEIPLHEEMLDLFVRNDLSTVYKTLAATNRRLLSENRRITKHKGKLLSWGHTLMLVMAVLIVMFGCTFLIHQSLFRGPRGARTHLSQLDSRTFVSQKFVPHWAGPGGRACSEPRFRDVVSCCPTRR